MRCSTRLFQRLRPNRAKQTLCRALPCILKFVPAVFVTRSYILRTNAYGIHRLRDSSMGMRVSSRRAQNQQIAANLNLRFEMPA